MKVTQEHILQIMADIASDELGDEIHMDDLAEHCNVSQATIRRRLDGLVYQRKVIKVAPMIYALKELK